MLTMRRHRTEAPESATRAFTLVEMAMVLLLTGLVAGIVLKLTASSGTAECYTTTKAQLNGVKDAIERFALKNDRFPMPARRNVGVESPVYGREAVIADLDKVTNADSTVAVFGALPFQALGVPVENAMDCWGNKLTYAVTLDLTDTTKFLVPATNGALDIKTDNSAAIFLKGAGYAIISHGEDQLGAVKNNYDSGAVNDAASRKWCSSTAELRTQDCDVTNNALVDAVFNNGKDAAANYFDDLIVYRGKPWRGGVAANSSGIYCWGDNKHGQIGDDSSNNERDVPTKVKSSETFTQVTAGSSHSCALDGAGKAYCWGSNDNGQLGNGTNGNGTYEDQPVAVVGINAASAPLSYISISAGWGYTCGVATDKKAYCWGMGSSGQLGVSPPTLRNRPTPVLDTAGGTSNPLSTFISIDAGKASTCGVTLSSGIYRTYCWGSQNFGKLGITNPFPNANFDFSTTLQPYPKATSGPLLSSVAAAVNTTSCGLTSSGQVYCWGGGSPEELGGADTSDGSHERCWESPGLYQNCQPWPSAIAYPSAMLFGSIAVGSQHSCGLDRTDGRAYCWGNGSSSWLGGAIAANNYKVVGPNGNVNSALTFSTAITTGGSHSCAIAVDGKAYCWGFNNYGQLGDGSNIERYMPTAVVGPEPYRDNAHALTFKGISGGLNHTCAVAGDPPIPVVNGECGVGIEDCSAGDYGVVLGSPQCQPSGHIMQYDWNCLGTGGGTTKSCSAGASDMSCP